MSEKNVFNFARECANKPETKAIYRGLWMSLLSEAILDPNLRSSTFDQFFKNMSEENPTVTVNINGQSITVNADGVAFSEVVQQIMILHAESSNPKTYFEEKDGKKKFLLSTYLEKCAEKDKNNIAEFFSAKFVGAEEQLDPQKITHVVGQVKLTTEMAESDGFLPRDTATYTIEELGNNNIIQGCGQGKTGEIRNAAITYIREQGDGKQAFIMSSTAKLANDAVSDEQLKSYAKAGIKNISKIEPNQVKTWTLNDGKYNEPTIIKKEETDATAFRNAVIEAYKSAIVVVDNGTLMMNYLSGEVTDEQKDNRMILVDEADTAIDKIPVQKKGQAYTEKENENRKNYRKIARIILKSVIKDKETYEHDHLKTRAKFTQKGQEAVKAEVEKIITRLPGEISENANMMFMFIQEALDVEVAMIENQDYFVVDGKISTVSQPTGEVTSEEVPEGLRQALAVKLMDQGRDVDYPSETRVIDQEILTRSISNLSSSVRFVSATMKDSFSFVQGKERTVLVAEENTTKVSDYAQTLREDKGVTIYKTAAERRSYIAERTKELLEQQPVLIDSLTIEETEEMLKCIHEAVGESGLDEETVLDKSKFIPLEKLPKDASEKEKIHFQQNPEEYVSLVSTHPAKFVVRFDNAGRKEFLVDKGAMDNAAFIKKYGCGKSLYADLDSYVKGFCGNHNVAIVSTNVAGRGVTIDVKDKKQVGLHVFVNGSQLSSADVEQISGRSARKNGDHGSFEQVYDAEDKNLQSLLGEEFGAEIKEGKPLEGEEAKEIISGYYEKTDERNMAIIENNHIVQDSIEVGKKEINANINEGSIRDNTTSKLIQNTNIYKFRIMNEPEKTVAIKFKIEIGALTALYISEAKNIVNNRKAFLKQMINAQVEAYNGKETNTLNTEEIFKELLNIHYMPSELKKEINIEDIEQVAKEWEISPDDLKKLIELTQEQNASESGGKKQEPSNPEVEGYELGE